MFELNEYYNKRCIDQRSMVMSNFLIKSISSSK